MARTPLKLISIHGRGRRNGQREIDSAESSHSRLKLNLLPGIGYVVTPTEPDANTTP
jgi:hypothetical protein